MGAYSSFAMLALTNHVLVHMAMDGTAHYAPYGVLGDDVAIASRKVSNYYRDLLISLGVEINPIKGFDGGILEFAK
ncbi:RNA-dependent RNA polymerase, partial [Tuber borchii]